MTTAISTRLEKAEKGDLVLLPSGRTAVVYRTGPRICTLRYVSDTGRAEPPSFEVRMSFLLEHGKEA